MNIHDLARIGAEARRKELQDELNQLNSFLTGKRAARVAAAVAAPARRNRKPMTAAQRKAVSLRMKTYWANRKKTAKS